MTRIAIVRHGQSEYNVAGRIQGQTDTQLTALGRLQAEAAAEYLKDWHFDAAYASDLERAFETCSRIAARHEGLKVTPVPELREIYFGKWQGMTSAEAAEAYPEEFSVYRNDYCNSQAPDGEPMRDMDRRARDIMWRIAKAHEGQTVLVTSHAGPMRSMQCEWLGLPFDRIRETPGIKNAALYVVDYDTESMTCTLAVQGENSYLANIKEPKSEDRLAL